MHIHDILFFIIDHLKMNALRLLEYRSENVPPGGFQVYAHLCSLTKSYGKEAAGHIFHDKALLQSGLIRGTCVGLIW